MVNYKKLYLLLFHAITDAIEQLDTFDIDATKEILITAQQDAEELYMSEDTD